ncbi:Hypothetical protein NGAL_HAMBI1146_59710 [Neorhizobium galegae bv. officinalis]|nr:Hypothetical protein NGAL_HAMBI1146_59710 [Neorhizobium galegae bv. officinalis]
MVIAFPRDLPAVGYTAVDLVLNDGVTASRTRGKLTNYTQGIDPFWEVSLTSLPLTYSQFSAVEAWWFSLRGGTASKGVRFRHPHVCYPQAHRQNQAPADDDGNLISVTEGNVLNVGSVAAGLLLSEGDFVGVEYQARTYLGKVTEVSGVGTSRAIRVEPPPYTAVAQANAVVRFVRPPLVMRPVPGSFSAPRSGRFYTVSFRLQE